MDQARTTNAPDRVRALLSRQGPTLAALLLCTALSASVMGGGVVRPELFNTYYDALGESMVHGHFDVPFEDISYEAFYLDGKSYGYFGPTSAVIRLPLNLIFPSMRGHWTRPMMIAACFMTLVGSLQLLRAAAASRGASALGRWLEVPFIVCAAFATPLVFIVRSPILYHEASAVAVAFAVWTYAFIVQHRRTGGFGVLFAALVCALASWQARGSVGAGALLALALQIASMLLALLRGASARMVKQTVALAVTALLCVTVAAVKNVVVYGNLSGIPPLNRHMQIMANPERLALTDGGHFFQPQNLRATLYNYLSPSQIDIGAPFPYLRAIPDTAIRTFPETKLDFQESVASMTVTSTFWCVLVVVGLFALRPGTPFATFRIPVVGAVAGAVPMLMVACITQRFLHDTYPLLVTAGAVGYAAILSARGGSTPGRFRVGWLVLLGAISCATNLAVVLTMPPQW